MELVGGDFGADWGVELWKRCFGFAGEYLNWGLTWLNVGFDVGCWVGIEKGMGVSEVADDERWEENWVERELIARVLRVEMETCAHRPLKRSW